MQLQINGERREFDARSLSVAGLLEALEIQSQRVAVELNESIVKRADYAACELRDGDILEILNFVGGG